MTITKPVVGSSINTWGTILNTALDSLQTQIDTVTTTAVPGLQTQIDAVAASVLADADLVSRNVRLHGAYGNGIADDTTAIQACINALAAAGGLVFLPPGTYRITAALTLPSGVGLIGAGRAATIIKGALTTALLKSPNTATRYYNWLIRDIGFDNTSRLNAGAIAVDMTNISHARVDNVTATNVATGLVLKDAAYYNQLSTFQVSGAVQGVNIGGGATTTNECEFDNLRVNDVTDGILINNSTNMTFFKPAIEAFTGTGMDIAPTAATQYVNMFAGRFENTGGVGTAVRNRALAQATSIFGGMCAGLASTYINSAAAKELSIFAPSLANPRTDTSVLALYSGTNVHGQFYATGSTYYFRNATDTGYLALDAGSITARGTLYTTGDLTVGTVGRTLNVKEGTNAKMGVATLVGGTVTVATTNVTATSRIQLTAQSLGTVTTPKALAVTARTAGTSFTILSADATDTSVVAWFLVEPA